MIRKHVQGITTSKERDIVSVIKTLYYQQMHKYVIRRYN